LNNNSSKLRNKIVREAANLLYSGSEKEFKQAKQKAAKTFKCKFLPTNLEVAIELDRIAEENEGPERIQRLIQMRKEALKTMNILKAYSPILVGSVWRGTIHHESDIDIRVYHDEPNDILKALKKGDYEIVRTELTTVTEKGRKKTSFHAYLESSTQERIEIIVRSSEELNRKEKCEIYGDEITGLNLRQLERTLEENPAKRFLPV
jgi:predicted nucleotidyltransferase